MRSWLLLALLCCTACGARTGLDGAEACAEAGSTRGCDSSCGAGTQLCDGKFWQACVPTTTTRTCSGVCGSGSQSCTDSGWSICSVPVATRSCSNDCGAGIESCTNDAWQACVVPVTQRVCTSACGSGHESCSNGSWGGCDAPQPRPPRLSTIVRDFRKTQSDFELPVMGDATDRGMVEQRLGADRTPVYAGHPTTRTTPSGKAGFDVWYHDTDGVNLRIAKDLQLTEVVGSPGSFVYDNRRFFPIDGELYGNEGLPHNYHFTLETHTSFVYRGGEVFSFSGDDDVWVFIADQLAIDLGGLHQIQSQSVSLDRISVAFGLVIGQQYPLDLFFAERHTVASDFVVQTTIADVGSCN